MLWVLKRTVSLRLFFWASKTYVEKNILIDFMPNFFVCLEVYMYEKWVALSSFCQMIDTNFHQMNITIHVG